MSKRNEINTFALVEDYIRAHEKKKKKKSQNTSQKHFLNAFSIIKLLLSD